MKHSKISYAAPLLAASLMSLSAPAMAAVDNGSEQVIVQSPYALQPNAGEPETWSLGSEKVSASVPVSLAGLDLRNPADAALVKDRVRDAAWTACRKLDRDFPEGIYARSGLDNDNCIEKATMNGMAQARNLE